MNRLSVNARHGAVVALVLIECVGLSRTTRAQTPPTRTAMAANPPYFLELARKTLKWDEPAEPVKIAGPIYSVGTKGLGVFLIRTSEGLVIINTAMPGSGPMTEAAIRKLGMDPNDIRLLLTGHAHLDHAGALAHLQKISGAKMAAINEEKDFLEAGGKLDFHYAEYEEFHFDSVKVDWVFDDGDVLKLGDVAITALLTPGHTKGATTFVTSVVDSGTIYTVVFPSGLSVNPGYRLVKNPSYPGIADDFRRTIGTLEMLKPDIWLSPHTETYDFEGKFARSKTEGIKAWIDPDGYRSWLVEQRKNFEAVLAEELGTAQSKQ